MLIPQSVKDRAIKIAIPILLEKFEPALLNIIAAKDKVILADDEQDTVVILHIVNKTELYATTAVMSKENAIKRILNSTPVKDLLLTIVK